MKNHSIHHRSRLAMTLVELLVVVVILGILLGIAATAVKSGNKGKKLREAARQVNVFLAGAQARAIELGRPVGVEFIRNENENRACLQLFLTETPLPYAGDLNNAVLRVTNYNTSTGIVTLTDSTVAATFSGDLISIGDEIQLNYRGKWYEITDYTPPNAASSPQVPMRIQFRVPSSDDSFIYGVGDDVNFKIIRQPIRSSVLALQMPSDTCIDLGFSGMGIQGQQFHPVNTGDASRLGFTFNSRGAIDKVGYYDFNNSQYEVSYPTGSIYLLIGRYDGVLGVNSAEVDGSLGVGYYTSPDPSADPSDASLSRLPEMLNAEQTDPFDDPSNLNNPASYWIVINHLSGKITTANNAYMSNIGTPGTTKNWTILERARALSKEAYSIDGRGGQ